MSSQVSLGERLGLGSVFRVEARRTHRVLVVSGLHGDKDGERSLAQQIPNVCVLRKSRKTKNIIKLECVFVYTCVFIFHGFIERSDERLLFTRGQMYNSYKLYEYS